MHFHTMYGTIDAPYYFFAHDDFESAVTEFLDFVHSLSTKQLGKQWRLRAQQVVHAYYDQGHSVGWAINCGDIRCVLIECNDCNLNANWN